MKENTKTWMLLLVLLPIISGIYGILHDQITYSISSEYFTHFKFYQFRIHESVRESERLATALVGVLSTWWVGILLAIPLGVIGFQKMSPEQYRATRIQSVKILFLFAIIFGVVGYVFGLIQTAGMSDWPMTVGSRGPLSEMMNAMLQIKDWDSFIIVGWIHNFSYFGALVGLIVAMVKQYRGLKRL